MSNVTDCDPGQTDLCVRYDKKLEPLVTRDLGYSIHVSEKFLLLTFITGNLFL